MKIPALLLLLAPAFAQENYQILRTGNARDLQTQPAAGMALMGGGTDQADAFRWFLTKAAGGDVVVLRASGTDAYNPYMMGLAPLNSVTTIVIKDRAAASDPAVLDKVRHAEAIFFAGGDQWNYVRMWRDTPLSAAIQERVREHVPIGGTSAGLAILGQYYFSAMNDTVQSPAALVDPFDAKITVGHDFLTLPFLTGVITDSHFVRRDRLGRTIAFLARMINDGGPATARAIAVDEKNAVLVEANGSASLIGDGAAYFFETSRAPEVVRPGTPLTLRGVNVYRIRKDGKFDLGTWKGSGGTAYTISVVDGVLSSSQPGGAKY